MQIQTPTVKKLLYGPTVAFPVGLLLHYFFIAGVLVVILGVEYNKIMRL